LGGSEILEATDVSATALPILIQQAYPAGTIYYFEIGGTGVADIRVETINTLF
jgi:hypothetical protein